MSHKKAIKKGGLGFIRLLNVIYSEMSVFEFTITESFLLRSQKKCREKLSQDPSADTDH